MAFQYTIQTRYSETAQDGIIHHPSYAVYFEIARIEFFKSIGIPEEILKQFQRNSDGST